MIKLSIIIPTRNEGEKLIRCLDSINNQRYDKESIEVIVVNDAGKAIDVSRYGFAYVITNDENLGVSRTRRRGLEAAVGEWVTIVDADDYFANNYALACFDDAVVENPSANLIYSLEIAEKTKVATWPPFNLHGKFFRRSFLNNEGLTFSNDLKNFHDDWYFLTRVADVKSDVALANFASYVWTYDKNSLSHSVDDFYEYKFLLYQIPAFYRLIDNYRKEEKFGLADEKLDQIIRIVLSTIVSDVFKDRKFDGFKLGLAAEINKLIQLLGNNYSLEENLAEFVVKINKIDPNSNREYWDETLVSSVF